MANALSQVAPARGFLYDAHHESLRRRTGRLRPPPLPARASGLSANPRWSRPILGHIRLGLKKWRPVGGSNPYYRRERAEATPGLHAGRRWRPGGDPRPRRTVPCFAVIEIYFKDQIVRWLRGLEATYTEHASIMSKPENRSKYRTRNHLDLQLSDLLQAVFQT